MLAAIVLMLGSPGCVGRGAPAFSDTPRISWDRAVRYVEEGRVTSALQTHKRVVFIGLNDGRSFETREPAIDDILRIAREAPNAESISISTE